MRSKLSYFFFFFVLAYSSLAHALTLKSKFTHAEVGDFIVYDGRGTMSLVFVKACDSRSVILEEVTFPRSAKPKKTGVAGWQEWLNNGAPGHTSWSALEIDLNETGISECFSFTRDAWLSLVSGDSFLLRVLDMKLFKIPDSERNKIGPPPEKGIDNRKTWNPPLIIDGKKQSNRAFEVFRIDWPSDDSPLSKKQIELYFNQKDKLFPFPYLLRIRDVTDLSLSFKVIDSGKGIISPKEEMPRRIFFLTKTNFSHPDQIEFELAAPRYYKKFTAHAVDADPKTPETFSLPFELTRDQEKVTIRLEKSVLQKKLKPFHHYYFTFSTEAPAQISVQSKELFTP